MCTLESAQPAMSASNREGTSVIARDSEELSASPDGAFRIAYDFASTARFRHVDDWGEKTSASGRARGAGSSRASLHRTTNRMSHLDELSNSVRDRARRRGISMVEIVVMLAIVTVALGMFARTMSSTRTLDPVATENAVAASAMRSKLEELRNHPFHEIYQRFNADPNDDPEGAGTSPGAHFAVEGLTPPGANVMCGTISFPTVNGQLREDSTDTMLGMPRDLLCFAGSA